MSVEVQVTFYITFYKTTNAFGISRASVFAIVKRVPYAITTFSEPEPINFQLLKKGKELKKYLLGTNEFPQCLRTIDDTHIEIAELNEQHSDYINRKS